MHATAPIDVDALIERLHHVLPSQAPLKDFVHHNTLHGFESLPFAHAVVGAEQTTGARGYLPLSESRAYYRDGRINDADLRAALRYVPELAADDTLLMLTDGPLRREAVYRVMLLHDFPGLTRAQLAWQLEDQHALTRYAPDVDAAARTRAARLDGRDEATALTDLWHACLEQLGLSGAILHPEDLLDPSPEVAEAILSRLRETVGGDLRDALMLRQHVHTLGRTTLKSLRQRIGAEWTLRRLLMALTGVDLMHTVRPALIRHMGAYLDRGISRWHHPQRSEGFYAAWRATLANDLIGTIGDIALNTEFVRELPADAMTAVTDELRWRGLAQSEWLDYLEQLTLELPGWWGMWLWHAEAGDSDAPVRLVDGLAVHLVLERAAAARITQQHWGLEPDLNQIEAYFDAHPAELLVRHALFEERLTEYLLTFAERLTRLAGDDAGAVSDDEWERIAALILLWRAGPASDQPGTISATAWPLFQLAQHLGLTADEIRRIGRPGVDALRACASRIDTLQAGYLWLLAYEHHYREQVFAVLHANHGRCRLPMTVEAQLVFCMDDREEGLRRHLEETNPALETLGAAGFFGLPIWWRGLDDATPSRLCPVGVRPAHLVEERPTEAAQRQGMRHAHRHAQRLWWRARWFQDTRLQLVRGVLFTLLGGLAAPLWLGCKTMLPGVCGALAAWARRWFEPLPPTTLAYCAPADAPAARPEQPRLGFTDDEQAEYVYRFLRSIGLTRTLAPLVAMVGHGSASENNPHLAAYDCGACSGRHGGPNARVFAAMANRPEVRTRLAARGLVIPNTTWFLGLEHNTCDDSFVCYDEAHVPPAWRPSLARLKDDLAHAGRAHAQERCRRFASAPPDPGPRRALRHVTARMYDFSQTRPELGHATNAMAFIGRRSRTRGTFLDRRAFLVSYDPAQDADGTVLEAILLAAGPVGAGINLEYYFSTVNNERYGCGTKTVHNIAGLFGVMEGNASDLRTGLPRQMIEIHEPMRLLLVVEARPELVRAILERQPTLHSLIGNEWMQCAVLDPDTADIHFLAPGQHWQHWSPSGTPPPCVERSADWFAGRHDALPPALLIRPLAEATP